MKLKDLIVGGIIGLMAPVVVAQAEITWGEQYSKSGGLVDVFPLNPSNFYTLRWQGNNVFGAYHLGKIDDLKEVKSSKISSSVNKNIANFEDVILIEERPAVILSNVKDGKDNIYLQQYSYDLEPRGEAKLIASYDLVKGKTKDAIQVIQSKDKKFTAIIWLLVGKKRDNDTYGFKVLDTKLNVVQKGEIEIPFESRNSVVTQKLLTNTGEFFFTLSEYDYDNYRSRDKISPFKDMYLYQVKEDELSRYKLPFKGRRPEAISITSDDDSQFTITGCYGDENVPGISGLFFMHVDFVNEEITREGFTPFDRGFITQNWSDRELNRLERRIENGAGEPMLYNYRMRDAQILPDGSMVGMMEQYYVQQRNSYDARGFMNVTYVYYYNDIVVYKFAKDGTMDWVKNIRKQQISTNDGGPYSSYASFIDGQEVNLIFNDSKENYSPEGTYLNDRLYSTSFSKKNNVVTQVKIDLFSGLTSREILTGRKDMGSLIKPKLFKNDIVNREMIVFSVFKGKENFGIIKY